MVSTSLLFNIFCLNAHNNTPTCVFLSSKHRDKLQPQSRISLRDLQKSSTNSRPTPNATTNSAGPATGPASSLAAHSEQPDTLLLSNLTVTAADPCDNISLADVTVPLESIKPSKQMKQWCAWCGHTVAAVFIPVFLYIILFWFSGSLLPVTVFDKHSLRVLFTFARDCPPSRPDVLVVIISMLSSAPSPVTNIRFQSAVPKVRFMFSAVTKRLLVQSSKQAFDFSCKNINIVRRKPYNSNEMLFVLIWCLRGCVSIPQVMKVKLQPPSSTELPAFNPILPPAAITQILLLANPHKVCHSLAVYTWLYDTHPWYVFPNLDQLLLIP